MADVKINVVAEVGQAVSDLKKVDETLGGMGKATKSASLSLTDLKSGLDLALGAVKATTEAIKSVIEPVVDYAAEIRTLSRTIGSTAEESSKLIQAADDVGISAGTLQAALLAAVRKGVDPTIEGISALAEQYNAIEDPIERTAFLMENFGRSGAALGPLMEQGASGIRAAGEAAEAAGLVMSEEGVASARAYEIAMDDLEDSMMAVKIALSETLIPAITDAASSVSDYITFQRVLEEAQAAGILTSDEAGFAYDRVRRGVVDITTALAEVQGPLNVYNTQTEAAARINDMASVAIQSQTQWLADQVTAVDASTAATYAYNDAATLLDQGLAGLTEKMIFNQAAMALSDEAALQLGIDMGIIDTRVLALDQAIPALQEKYGMLADGTFASAGAATAYAEAVERLTAALMSIPANVTSTVTTNYVSNGTGYGGPAGPPATPQYEAEGGNYMPGALVTGERGPELQFPNTPGYVMNNGMSNRLVDALEAIAQNGGGNTYVVNGTYANQSEGTVAAELALMDKLYS